MEEAKRLRTLLQNAIEVMAEDCGYEKPDNKKTYILGSLGVTEKELVELGIDLEEALR